MKEFNLRKEREELFEIILHQRPTAGRIYRIIKKQDKEFIKKLKEKLLKTRELNFGKDIWFDIDFIIDKLAGDL